MPDLHPFFVHFPIALLTVALCVDGWASLRKDDHAWKCGWMLQAIGTVTLLLSVATGILASQSAPIPEGARGAFDIHRQGAFVGTAIFTALALWRVGVRGRLTGVSRAAFFVLYGAGVTGVLLTGWFGGRLVAQFGVGVTGN